MKFISNLVKIGLTTLNDKIHDTKMKSSQKKAYSKTGKDIKNARKSGTRINGSLAYRKNKAQYEAKVKKQRKTVQYLIELLVA